MQSVSKQKSNGKSKATWPPAVNSGAQGAPALGINHATTIASMKESAAHFVAIGQRDEAIKLYRVIMAQEARPEMAAEAVDQLAADLAPEAPRSSLDDHHRDNLCHDNEGEASALALMVAALAPTCGRLEPADIGREALRGISDDLMLYSMADETEDGPVESIMLSAMYRIRRRADAAAEVIRRLQVRGNLEPDQVHS